MQPGSLKVDGGSIENMDGKLLLTPEDNWY